MEKFQSITSKVVPLALRDVDTDQIIPARFLTSVSRSGYGENLFLGLRQKDADFPLNQKKFSGASILVADDNFGCGSSREHAVWALLGAGFRVVIAKSFADIFAGNSAKNGLLLIVLPEDVVDNILKESRGGDYEVRVNLKAQEVELAGGKVCSFPYDDFRKLCLLEGLDDIDYILAQKEAIEEYRQNRGEFRFYSTLKPNHDN